MTSSASPATRLSAFASVSPVSSTLPTTRILPGADRQRAIGTKVGVRRAAGHGEAVDDDVGRRRRPDRVAARGLHRGRDDVDLAGVEAGPFLGIAMIARGAGSRRAAAEGLVLAGIFWD